MDVTTGKRTLSDAFKAVSSVLEDMMRDNPPEMVRASCERLLWESGELHRNIDFLLNQMRADDSMFRVTIPYDSARGDKFSYYVDNRIITFETTNDIGGVLDRNQRRVKLPSSATVDDLLCTEDKEGKVMVITLKYVKS